MGTLYVDTGGLATNSGSSDNNAADLSGAAATVAGSVVTLDGSPDLSGLITSGSTQSSIHLNSATNANRKIFWITAFDNTAKTVTVDVAPTGIGGTTTWKIGGRHLLTNNNIEGALRAGDVVIFNNSPASAASTIWTFRNAGTSAAGPAMIRNKTGVSVTFTDTGNSAVVSTGVVFCTVDGINLTNTNTGASAHGFLMNSTGSKYYNGKITIATTGGARCIANTLGATNIAFNAELTQSGGNGIGATMTTNTSLSLFFCRIHDMGGDGVLYDVGHDYARSLVGTIIDSCAGRGINMSVATGNNNAIYFILGCTVYNCGNSGLEVADADTQVLLFNNIFHSNGNAAGEFNVEWVAGAAENVSLHGYNIFFQGGGSAGNVSGLTLNAQFPGTEFDTDPQLVDPAGGDFTPGPNSPAIGAGFPGAFAGGGLTGYADIGAVQRQMNTAVAAPVFGGLVM